MSYVSSHLKSYEISAAQRFPRRRQHNARDLLVHPSDGTGQEYLIWGTWRKLIVQEHPYQDRSGRSLISNLCMYYQAPVAEFSSLTRGRERGDSGRPYLNLHPLPSEPKVTQTSRCSDTTLSRPRIPRTRNPEGWFGITTHNTHNLSDRNKRWYI